MANIQRSSNWNIGNKPFARSENFVGEGIATLDEITLAAAQPGNATVAGTVVLADTPVGIAPADLVSVIWDASGQKLRRNCVVDSVTGDTIVLSGGDGDALPSSTAVFLSAQIEARLGVDGDDIQILSIQSSLAGWVASLLDDTGAELAYYTQSAGGIAGGWDNLSGIANPFTGERVDKVRFAATTAVSTGVWLGVLADSVS